MNADEFLARSEFFSLGHLPTEGIHPKTVTLSQLSQKDPLQALNLLAQIDQGAFRVLETQWEKIQELRKAITECFQNKSAVYLTGCGATGRLALSLESLHRRIQGGQGRVHALMAGGDYALVKSVENFEDFPEYGARHLDDLHFGNNDLLIAITEGGETPYVLGTLDRALEKSIREPWFVFCNPPETLMRIERSKKALTHARVQKMELTVGSMVLSGSTRMQAATVQMLAVGCALFQISLEELRTFIRLSDEFSARAAETLNHWIQFESESYKNKHAVLVETNSFPITVLTDTTERSPTFSLTAFESKDRPKPTSWVYLSIPNASDSVDAWQRILNRSPKGLDWPELKQPLDFTAILEFDFSLEGAAARLERIQPAPQDHIGIHHYRENFPRTSDALELTLNSMHHALPFPTQIHPLFQEIQMKLYLNRVSLLIMGKLGRFEGNVMTYVRPTNGKLIDRAARYLEQIFKNRNLPVPTFEARVRSILSVAQELGPDVPVVLKSFEALTKTEFQSRS